MRARVFKDLITNDVLIILLLLSIAVLFSLLRVGFTGIPQEDAAMIMRYAQHFGQGHGIVWNIGEKPVDGGTDFLFIIVDGLLYRTGLSIEISTRLILYLAHLLNIIVVYLTIPRTSPKNRIIAVLGALALAFGPGFYYVSAYFATPFFALFASLTWFCGLKLLQDPEGKVWQRRFALLGLMTGLIRPEGVILVMLMLLAVVLINGFRQSLNLIATVAAVFVVLGGIYFIWRWAYFGYPLPNPFYKKGGGVLHYESALLSLTYMLLFVLPVLPAFILGILSKKHSRVSLGLLMVFAGFAAAFILISNEMNYRARFQYVILPISLMSWLYLMTRLDLVFTRPASARHPGMSRWISLVFSSLIAAFFLIYPLYVNNLWAGLTSRDGRYDIGLILGDYHDKGFTLATTEAGLLPLYSQWNTVDAWGLNDQWIAHHKLITETYLNEKKPEVIMIHFYSSPFQLEAPTDDWGRMAWVLKNYAEKNGYVLAASFSPDQSDTHSYYIRTDFEESREITNRIRALKYAWYTGYVELYNAAAKEMP